MYMTIRAIKAALLNGNQLNGCYNLPLKWTVMSGSKSLSTYYGTFNHCMAIDGYLKIFIMLYKKEKKGSEILIFCKSVPNSGLMRIVTKQCVIENRSS